MRRGATGRGGVARGRREKRGLRLAGNEVNKVNRAGRDERGLWLAGIVGATGRVASGKGHAQPRPPLGVAVRRGPGRGTEVVWDPPGGGSFYSYFFWD